ncbi:MAG: hypothetical protein AAF531_06625 [Actinomycetota bacterium]
MTSETIPRPPLSANDPAPEVLSFTCPRCGTAAEARFYGPCPTCSRQLQAAYQQTTNDVEAPEYEPKMNVTPNAVATKD